jgi:hypothetical protein
MFHYRIAILHAKSFLLQSPVTPINTVKGKVPLWGPSALQPFRLIVHLTPKGVPSFISRGAVHQAARATSVSEGRNYRWNLANNQ